MSSVDPKFDPYVAATILIVVMTLGVCDLMLFAFYGQQATFSAYLRRIIVTYPSVASVVWFALGALWAHIIFGR